MCIFLYGGNDYANTLPPYDQASYTLYAAARSNIAHARDALTATALTPSTALAGGRQYAMAPTMAPLLPLFANGKPAGDPQDFVTGFLDQNGHARGRPVGVAFNRGGALLIADDLSNTIWRVSRAGTS